MIQYDETTMIFVGISLFLVAMIIICQLIQFLFWLIVKLKTKNNDNIQPYYQKLLANQEINCQVVKKDLL